MITINVSPARLMAEVYNLSRPQGLGFLHYVPGDVTEEAFAAVVGRYITSRADAEGRLSYYFDHIVGRACKFSFEFKEGEGCTFDDQDWYDHTKQDLELLIQMCQTVAVTTGE